MTSMCRQSKFEEKQITKVHCPLGGIHPQFSKDYEEKNMSTELFLFLPGQVSCRSA